MTRCLKEGSRVKPDGFVISKINVFSGLLDLRLTLGQPFAFG